MIVCLSISFFKIKNIKEINPIIIKIRLCTNEWGKKKLVIYEIKIKINKPIKPNSLKDFDLFKMIEPR